MLTDTWQEILGTQILEKENLKICQDIANTITSTFEFIISLIRLIASKDSKGLFRCAPEGNIAQSGTVIFSYIVSQVGYEEGLKAFKLFNYFADRLKNYSIFQLVLSNLFVIIGLAKKTQYKTVESDNSDVLIEILAKKIQYLVERYEIFEDCDRLLEGMLKYYEYYHISPTLNSYDLVMINEEDLKID